MRITKIFLIGLWMLFAGMVSVSSVKAIGCVVYACYDLVCEDTTGPDPICHQEQRWCNGDCGGIDNGGCPPNTHINPNGSCGQNGSGGSTGGGWVEETVTGASCPANYTVDFSQPISSYCKVSSNKDVTYQPGSAERVTGCCSRMMEDEDGNEFCRYGDDQITTYACVPICTASAPSTPTLMSPANASNQSSTTASLLWNQVSSWGTACTGASNQYYVYLGTGNPPNYYTTVASNVTSINVANLTRGSTYYWQITASNGQLYSSSSVRSFTILNNQIAGKVFYDTANNCGGSGWSTGGVAVSLNGGTGNAITGAGTFSLTEPLPGPHTLAVSIPAGFICSTTAGCNTCSRSSISSPSANNNFYLTDLREAWWQAEGAGVYAGSMAGGVTIRSELPTALTKLILPGSGGTSAALMRASGQADLGEGSISSEGWSAITRYHGQRMGYQYFAAKMGVIPLQADDWFTNNLDDKPSGDAQEFYYQAGDSTISGPWVVNSGESYVVFIKGNLRVNANITVENGGFLAFVVKGSVTVDPSVTTLQGLYVMDTNFITESDYVLGSVNDVPLDVQGSIVSWGTLSISRNLGVGNFTTPAEKFAWRSDLLANMPRRMKMFLTNWQEVVPGTFGE